MRQPVPVLHWREGTQEKRIMRLALAALNPTPYSLEWLDRGKWYVVRTLSEAAKDRAIAGAVEKGEIIR